MGRTDALFIDRDAEDRKARRTLLINRLARLPLDVALIAAGAVSVMAIQGARSSTFDQLNNGAPVWVLGGLLVGAASIALARHKWPRIVLTGVVAVAGAVLVAPECVRTIPTSAAPAVLRVVELNAWKGNPRMADAARWLIEQDADVLILAEATRPLKDMVETRYPYAVSCLPDNRCSTVIYTKVKPLASDGLAKGGDPERREALSAAWVELPTSSGPVTIVALHLDHPYPMGRGEDEITPIRRLLDEKGRDRVVVAGDLNRTPWSFALGRVDKALAMPRYTRALPTWPAKSWIPTIFPIDHVYAGHQLVARDVRAGPDVGSDHLPVRFTIAGR